MDELSAAIQKVGAAMYASQEPNNKNQEPNAGTGPSSDNQNPGQYKGPVDAEYKEVPKQ